MKTYTVFCQHVSGIGTIWIDSVKALHIEEAKELAIAACADDWGCNIENVRVLGVAEGVVEIIEWDDLE